MYIKTQISTIGTPYMFKNDLQALTDFIPKCFHPYLLTSTITYKTTKIIIKLQKYNNHSSPLSNHSFHNSLIVPQVPFVSSYTQSRFQVRFIQCISLSCIFRPPKLEHSISLFGFLDTVFLNFFPMIQVCFLLVYPAIWMSLIVSS